jgi:hypothetical protein
MRWGGCTRASWPTGASTWAQRRWQRAADRRPIVKGGSHAGECGEAVWHRSRPLARVMSLRSTVATTLASDRGFSGALACARDRGTAGTTWRAGVRRRVGARALAPNRFKQPLSKRNFSKIPNKSAQDFEYESCSATYPLPVLQKLYGGLINRSSIKCTETWQKTRHPWIVDQHVDLHFSPLSLANQQCHSTGKLCASTNCTTFPLGDFEVSREILENVP